VFTERQAERIRLQTAAFRSGLVIRSCPRQRATSYRMRCGPMGPGGGPVADALVDAPAASLRFKCRTASDPWSPRARCRRRRPLCHAAPARRRGETDGGQSPFDPTAPVVVAADNPSVQHEVGLSEQQEKELKTSANRGARGIGRGVDAEVARPGADRRAVGPRPADLAAAPRRRRGPRPEVADALKLSAEQRESVRAAWGEEVPGCARGAKTARFKSDADRRIAIATFLAPGSATRLTEMPRPSSHPLSLISLTPYA
jgi:hypothetical protein